MTRRGALAPLQRSARRSSSGATFALAFAPLALAACTTLQPAQPLAGETLSGRLALRVDASDGTSAKAFSAAFDLRGDPSAGTLALATPLGSTLAQARWSPSEVVLATPQGTRRFANLDELTREALGESVPIEAWFDWLRGRPWPGAPSEAAPELKQGFSQLGWRVDLASFAAEGTLNATRTAPPPTVTVRIRLDRS